MRISTCRPNTHKDSTTTTAISLTTHNSQAASSPSTMSTFPFLALPTEIQDKMLEHHFCDPFNLCITQHVIGAHFNAVVGHRRVYAAGDSTHFSILRVSPLLYEQAKRALHRSFTGHLDLSSVQYSSKYSMSGSSIPIPPSLPMGLLTSIDLGKIEWREGTYCVPYLLLNSPIQPFTHSP